MLAGSGCGHACAGPFDPVGAAPERDAHAHGDSAEFFLRPNLTHVADRQFGDGSHPVEGQLLLSERNFLPDIGQHGVLVGRFGEPRLEVGREVVGKIVAGGIEEKIVSPV